MTIRKLSTIFVQAIFALFILATVTSAQTATPSPATQASETQSAQTNTANSSELVQSAATTQADQFSLERPDDRLHLDLTTAKTKSAKGSLVRKTSHSLTGAAELESESTEAQDPTPAAAPAAPASNGSSPVDLITRIEMKYQFQNFASGYLHGVPIIRVDYAFSKAMGFRIDLPVLHFDSRVPGQPNASGIGDVVTSMTFVRMPSKRFIFGVVPRIDFPTASASALGSGKYSFKPTLAGLTPLAPGLAFGTSLEYDVSFAGNKGRSDINELHIKPLFLKSFLKGPLKGYYANPQLEVIVDFENNNRSTWQAAVHMGKVLSKNVVVFVIPTVHVGGTKRESFKLEAGFRYLFR